MSVHDEGYGDNVRPTLEFESDFANRFRSVGAEGDQSWAADAHTAHRSEDSLMTSGPGRPGQPMPGQRSIFGTGRGPVFAQMPAYKPVTRAPEPQPHAPEPPRVPQECSACHAEIARTKTLSSHATLECTQCHQVNERHKVDPRASTPTKPAAREFCGQCHSSDAKAAPEIRRIDLSSHWPRYVCWQCHYSHYPEVR